MTKKRASGWKERLIAAAIVLAVWQLLTLFFPPIVLPRISSVAAKLAEAAVSGVLIRTVAVTTGRLLIGMAVGIVLGCGVGFLMGRFAGVRGILSPIVSLLQTIPPVSWVVLALIWFGFNGRPAIFIIVTSTLPIIAINIAEGFVQMDRRFLEMAKVYRFSTLKTLRHVILPSIHPYFYAALRISLGTGWKIAVMGEVLTTSDGIGGMIKNARLNIEPESVIAWTVVTVLLFYLSDFLAAVCFRSKKEWEYAANNGS